MKRVRIAIMIAAIGLASTGAAYAQLGKLVGSLTGGSAAGGATPESLVKGYVEGSRLVLRAQERLLSAIGKKEEAAKAALHADNLTQGATQQSLSDATKVQTENSKMLEESFKAQGTTLDAESKVVYGQGLGLLGKGTARYVALVPEARGFKPSLSNLSVGTMQAASYVVTTLPGNSASLQGTLSAAVQYGQSQGVEVPADATAALNF